MRAYLRLFFRLPTLFGLIALELGHLTSVGPFIPRSRRRSWRTRTNARYCRLGFRLLNIRVEMQNAENLTSPSLIVANHISYIDVLAISSLTPSVFVSSVEVQQAPLIGRLTRLAGGIFIERRKRSELDRETDAISDCLKTGHILSVFPEGTSTDGTTVLPFKSSILASAAKAGVPVVPLAIDYREINGKEMTRRQNRQPIAFCGDMIFIPHLLALLKDLRCCRVVLTVFPPIPVNTPQQRKEVAVQAHQLIAATV